MSRNFVGLLLGAMLLCTVTLFAAEPRGRGGENSGARKPNEGKPPGGSWGEPKPSGNQYKPAGAEAAHHNNQPQATGAQGAAAEHGLNNRNQPQHSAAEGAAAGKAVTTRNEPKATGAEGVAAGAAVTNRNEPKATGAEGVAAGAAVSNRNSPTMTGAQGAAVGYAAVQNSFDRHDLYNQAWHGAHPAAWTTTAWSGGTVWTPTPWTAVAAHCGYGATTPVSYNYGTNVTCVNGAVAVNGQSVGTAEEFSQQASDLAQAGTDAQATATEKWIPLGVFAMVRNEDQHPQLILQMAINQAGVLRGNYTDEVTDNTQPIQGSVDPKTQRAAWTIGGNTSSVMEAGLANMTAGEAPALLHKNGKTERWVLVRLKNDPTK